MPFLREHRTTICIGRKIQIILAILATLALAAGIALPAGAANNTTTTATSIATTVPTQNTTTTTTTTSATTASAGFSGVPISGYTPLTVQFTDLSTGGSPTAWTWDFGDNGTAYVKNPSHVYTEAGTYTVKLIVVIGGKSYTSTRYGLVSVDENETATTTTTTTTTSTTLKAGFTASPVNGPGPLTVKFTDNSTGSPISWTWDFGDGASSTVQNPTHNYTVPGSYTVSMVAKSASGTNLVSYSNLITVTGGSTTAPTETSATATVTKTVKKTTTATTSETAAPTTRQTTAVVTPVKDSGKEGGIPFMVILVAVIAIVAVIGIIIWRRRNEIDELA
jgi:large repetitive protein